VGDSLRSSREEFIARALKKHGRKYGYEKVVYTTALTPVDITCPVHGVFRQAPADHLAGKGCRVCYRDFQRKTGGGRRISFEKYRERAIQVHAGKYAYEVPAGFIGKRTKVNIICPKHGIFRATIDNHVNNGSGCPRCGVNLSLAENEVYNLVKSLCPDAVQRDRKTIAPFELDVAVPSVRIAFEFNGEHWHSVRIADRHDKSKTLKHLSKWKRCHEAGYALFTIWASDWASRRQCVENWIRYKLGKAELLCYARECQVVRIRNSAAISKFYTAFHLQGAPGPGLHYGLEFNGRLVAAMTFTKSSASRKGCLGSEEYVLSRLAVAGKVPGAASRLFSAFVKESGAKRVYTYSDNEYAVGSVYTTLGFLKIGEVAPDYRVWHNRLGIRHKEAWQRKSIPCRLQELEMDEVYHPETDPRTEYEMEDLAGCRHIWNCGRIKWEWRPQSIQL
jgi:hypothetical protein